MLEICIQTSYDQNVQLILKSYLPVVYGIPLTQILPEVYGTTLSKVREFFRKWPFSGGDDRGKMSSRALVFTHCDIQSECL
jgi:hypothetical protein